MPIISGLKALAAWARHPAEHVAVCTVLGGGGAACQGPETAVWFQERQLSELQRASLPVLGLWPHARCLATHPRLVLREGMLTPALHRSSGCTGDVDARLCSPPPEGLCVPAAKLSHAAAASALCCCTSALRLPSSAPRGVQLGPYWPTPLQPQPQPQPAGPAGEWLMARSAAHRTPWGMALRRRAYCCSYRNMKF